MTSLSITSETVAALTSEVAAWGCRGVETGGFLLGGDDRAISCIALSGGPGIRRDRNHFRISGRAVAALFIYADEHDYAIHAQFHSHRGSAFLSDTDLAHGFDVDGFVTAVLPTYASPPLDLRAWGWWAYRGNWLPTRSPVVVAGDTRVLRFDEEGVRES